MTSGSDAPPLATAKGTPRTGADIATAGGGQDDVWRGIVLMTSGMLFIPTMDIIAKYLVDTVPAGQIAWGRFAFQALFTLPFAYPLLRRHGWASAFTLAQLVRGPLIAVATLCFFGALAYMPVADALAIFFVEPLLLTALSPLLLGEKVGPRRWTAVAIGFIGALVIIRPGSGVFGSAALLPLATALCFALYLVVTRRFMAATAPFISHFMAGLTGLVPLSIAMGVGAFIDWPVFDPVWPSPFEWLLMATIGLISTLAHLLVLRAFLMAPASVLAPLNYVEIISATILGFIVFGDFPRATTWAGIAIIVGSGIYVSVRERRLGSHERAT